MSKAQRPPWSWWRVNEYGQVEWKMVDFIDRVFHVFHPQRNAFWHDVSGDAGKLPSLAEVEAHDITARDSIGRRLRMPARRPPRVHR